MTPHHVQSSLSEAVRPNLKTDLTVYITKVLVGCPTFSVLFKLCKEDIIKLNVHCIIASALLYRVIAK